MFTQSNIIPKSPVSRNGDRPQSPSPYTQPALLASVEALREDLVRLAAGIDDVLGHIDQAALFLDHRVERARVRERRRNGRGTRKQVTP